QHVIAANGLHKEEAAALQGYWTIPELKEALGKLPGTPSERHTALKAFLDKHFKKGAVNAAVGETLELPKFLFFSQYQRMPGQQALDVLKKKDKNYNDDERVFLAFCDLVGTPIDQIAAITQFEPMISKFEAASIKISTEIFRYWTQNQHLKVQF